MKTHPLPLLLSVWTLIGLANLANGAPPPSPTIGFAFDEDGKTISKVAGGQFTMSGTCPWENVAVTLSGAVNARVLAHQGHWETPAFSLESVAKTGPVEVTATVLAANGAPAATAKLKMNIVNLLQEGAVGDGKTDDLPAIKSALKKARALENGIVYAPAGHTFAHSDLVELDGQELLGGGEQTVFLATNPLKSAIKLKGNGAWLRNVTLDSTLGDTKRQSTPATTAAWIYKATNFCVDHVTVKSAASAGIFNFGGSGTAEAPARITNNKVSGTLADGIHNTDGAHHVLIEGNANRATGDDLIAVVSYDNEPEPCHDIVITHNTVGENNWGRGITVVGGHDVSILENTISASMAAGIYICAEDSFHTYGVENVLVRGNRISKSPANLPAHSGIFLSGRSTFPVSGVKIEANVIEESPAAAISLRKNVRGTTITGNQISGTPHEAILVMGATDTLITKNQIANTGAGALKVEKDAQGYCRIVDNQLTAINTTSKPHTAAISVDPGGTIAVEITGNKNHPSRYHVEKFVDCKSPNAVVKNNY